MPTQWTMRRNGEVEATIRVTYYVPRTLVDFLRKHSNFSEAAAMKYVRQNIGRLSDGWHTVSVGADGRVDVIHYDEAEHAEEDGDAVYDGRTVVMR